MPFSWDPRIARYRDDDTGRFVKRSAVLGIVEDSIAASVAAPPVTIDGITTAGSDFLAQMVGNGLMDPNDWNSLMRGEIKREYIRQYLLGIGGVEQMTPARWGQIGGLLGRDYKTLDAFTAEIAAGELSEAQIRARSRMYIRSAGEAYERANQIAQIEAGMTEMRWVLMPGAKHCTDCPEFADMGWVAIADDPYGGCVPKRGCTICLCITTPMCRVLTDVGYIPMMDVRVGDLVFTHEGNWKPVTALVIKRSLPGAREAVIISPDGQPVGCTTDHLWYTPDGWRNSLDIDNSLLSMYHLPILNLKGGNDDDKESVREMRFPFTAPEQADCVQIVSLGVSLWEYQRLPGSTVQELFSQRQSQDPMVQQEGRYLEWHQEGGGSKTYTVKGLRTAKVAGADRWSPMELVLAGGRGQKTHNLPVSVGVDYGERPDTRWLCLTQQRRGYGERRLEQPSIDDEGRARKASRQDCSRESSGQDGAVDLSKLPDGIQIIPAFAERSPQTLFPGVLAPGTAIYDLTVEGDHSFIIEGLVAHNTNCQCHLEYR